MAKRMVGFTIAITMCMSLYTPSGNTLHIIDDYLTIA